MITIRGSQLAVFEVDAQRKYAAQMRAILRQRHPNFYERIGPDEVHARILHGLSFAHNLGLRDNGEIGMFVELTFLFGSGFEHNASLSWTSTILDDDPQHRVTRCIGILYQVGLAEADNPVLAACVRQETA
jgi:hypothetical protein